MSWVKWILIITKSFIVSNTVVDFMGSTYIVYGNVVAKIRRK